ncbi:hypothetical protein CFOL_v3_33641 [Cephalotus follicularis]|uniref:Uncharacterized protein n=1 Tax=Cephalotus follicularis TaxID=3775 RepID=A0A1Q3DCP7_CEPFO|nr:hypothetical protein CFOL_v3_33641 [Cephalotus follicularis]
MLLCRSGYCFCWQRYSWKCCQWVVYAVFKAFFTWRYDKSQVEEMGLTSTQLLNTEKFPLLFPDSLFSSQVVPSPLQLHLFCSSSCALFLFFNFLTLKTTMVLGPNNNKNLKQTQNKQILFLSLVTSSTSPSCPPWLTNNFG